MSTTGQTKPLRRLSLGILAAVLFIGGLVLVLFLGSLKPETADPTLVNAPPTPSVRLSAPPADAVQVSGTVRFPDGSPADEILVRAWRPGQGRVSQTRSDPDGHYSLGVQVGDSVNLASRSSTPTAHPVDAPVDDLDFVTPARCPIDLRVEDPDGLALFPGEADASIKTEGFLQSSNLRNVDLDESGWSTLETACGQGRILVSIPGWSHGTAQVDTDAVHEVTVVLERGVEVFGHVRTTSGDAVTAGTVRVFKLGAKVEVDEEGAYSLFLPRSDSHRVTAEAQDPGLLEESHTLRLDPDQDSFELDFELQPFRRVEVKCVGLPDDSCKTVTPVFCTLPRLPAGELCSGNPTTCACPSGEVAVRAGGKSVLVPADEKLALLDFRDANGGVTGRVLMSGQPSRCRWTVLRVPEWDALGTDLSGGGVVARQGRCDKDGVFSADKLEPGTYIVELATGELRNPQPDVAVADSIVDLGDIDLGGGGVITGVVRSGVTGEPENNQPVLTSFAERETVNPVGAGALSGQDGVFEITGLEDGSYAVFLAQRPLERVQVQVVNGVASQDVTLETGQAKLLDEQGFAVVTSSQGKLQVSSVTAGSLAESAGLITGDEIAGIIVLGVDVLEVAPNFASEATNWALDNYSGPGMTLVVKRGGLEVEVPLQ
ncbi:MAG: hypothetical protein ACI9VR_002593 [Cognaticolwellia sp.]